MYVSEERLLLYILGVALTGSETSLWILSQQLKKMKKEDKTNENKKERKHFLMRKGTYSAHDSDGLEREEPRVADLVVHDAIEHFLFVVSRERGFADKHFEDKDTQAPPVDGSRVSRLCKHLGRKKLGSTAESASAVAEAHTFLAQAEIGNFDITLRIQQ